MFVAKKNRRLDRHHHTRLKRVGAAAEHVKRLAPGGREARGQSVAGRVYAAVVEAGLSDHALGGFVGYDGGNVGADFGKAGIGGTAYEVVELAHARRGRAQAELAADRGCVAPVGRPVLDVAE